MGRQPNIVIQASVKPSDILLPFKMNTEKVRNDFDEIARLANIGESGRDRYDSFLLSLVPQGAVDVLEVGCGLGRLTAKLATSHRQVTGIDLSPEMIERARQRVGSMPHVSFLCGDFLEQDLGAQKFDCVISAATLHHMPEDDAIPRMEGLLRPGGRLVIHDLRTDSGLLDQVRSLAALAQVAAGRLLRTGRVRSPREVREAWERHGAGEKYLTLQEAQGLANRLLPDARVYYHWLWRYTIVWDKPVAT
jgi:2-polyprenyl-3-methyl-5-hydroxy-6-metoxy-1,4-benzoquinol methylase